MVIVREREREDGDEYGYDCENELRDDCTSHNGDGCDGCDDRSRLWVMHGGEI